ncbi:MAG TPA: family 16 glycosylhydrolase [Longimicrobiales bacterium]|nr:family 16 glycosylhydrolase [Longimicrobiales bacterium]
MTTAGRGPALAGLVALALTSGGDPMGTHPAGEEDALPPGTVVDELTIFDPARWQVMDHVLGRGKVAAGNVVAGAGTVELRLPAGTFDGGGCRSMTLDFDPSHGFHDYRISWFPDRVGWRVDGTLAMTANGITPGTDLYLYVNAWWPSWLQGGPADREARAVVERLVT